MLCLIYLVYRGGGDIGWREMDGSRDVYGGGIGRLFSVLGSSNGPPVARRWWPNNFNKQNCYAYSIGIFFIYLDINFSMTKIPRLPNNVDAAFPVRRRPLRLVAVVLEIPLSTLTSVPLPSSFESSSVVLLLPYSLLIFKEIVGY